MLNILKSRRSIRRFRPEPVPETLLRSVIETAILAPSAHNRQPWRLVVLQSRQAKQSLIDHMSCDFRRDLFEDGLPAEEVESQVERSRQRISEAPVVILLCMDASVLDHYSGEARQQAEVLMGVQGVAMAGAHLLLAAHACGLAGVWMCAPLFAQASVRKALDLPETWEPQGLILLGYAHQTPLPPQRKPVGEVTVFL